MFEKMVNASSLIKITEVIPDEFFFLNVPEFVTFIQKNSNNKDLMENLIIALQVKITWHESSRDEILATVRYINELLVNPKRSSATPVTTNKPVEKPSLMKSLFSKWFMG
jgi:hypothetical protein